MKNLSYIFITVGVTSLFFASVCELSGITGTPIKAALYLSMLFNFAALFFTNTIHEDENKKSLDRLYLENREDDIYRRIDDNREELQREINDTSSRLSTDISELYRSLSEIEIKSKK